VDFISRLFFIDFGCKQISKDIERAKKIPELWKCNNLVAELSHYSQPFTFYGLHFY